MFGSKKRNARRALDEAWRKMEMSCENNYKDMAQDDLRDFEILLEKYRAEGILSPEEYQNRSDLLAAKKTELKNYDHKQRIGW